MRIITISREFGSGGREFGKRLADALHIPCYDHEIIDMIAEQHGFDKNYVAHFSEKAILAAYPLTIGRRLSVSSAINQQHFDIAGAQRKIIRQFALQGDCVIIGRGADAILRDMCPLNIFVYASLASKLHRCRERATAGETYTDKNLLRIMKKIDQERASLHELVGNTPWGKRESYHLCVNTSDLEIKSLIPALAAFAENWFTQQSDKQYR